MLFIFAVAINDRLVNQFIQPGSVDPQYSSPRLFMYLIDTILKYNTCMTLQYKPLQGMSVNERLELENAENLRWYARLLGADKKIIRKFQLTKLIAEHLNGSRLREIWSRLDDIQQTAVAETIYSTSLRFDEARFKAKYDQLPSFGTEHYYYRAHAKDGPTLARLLLHQGMPGELAERLKEFVPQPAPAQINISANERDPEDMEHGEDESDELTIVETEPGALRDLKVLLCFIREGKLRVSEKTGVATQASLKLIDNSLFGGDFYSSIAMFEEDKDRVGPIKAFAWPLLLQAAKLVFKEGSRLRLTKAGEKAFTLPAHETLRLMWKQWLSFSAFDELRRVEEIKGQHGKGRMTLTAVSTRRDAINRALRDCPADRWIDVNEFFRFMQSSSYYFEVSRDPWSLYITDSGYGSLGYDGYHDWEILQGRYILCLLFEYAATLGMVDVAYDSPVDARDDFRELWGTDSLPFLSRYDGLIRFRLTKLGAYCLGLLAEYSPKPITRQASFTVMPSMRLIVRGELSPDEESVLESFAERTAETEWQFSVIRTLKTIEAGHDVRALSVFLQKRDEQLLPDTIASFFRESVQRARAVKDRGEAKLIECSDAAVAERIANAERVKNYCMRAGDRHLVVPAHRLQQFRKELERLGHILSL